MSIYSTKAATLLGGEVKFPEESKVPTAPLTSSLAHSGRACHLEDCCVEEVGVSLPECCHAFPVGGAFPSSDAMGMHVSEWLTCTCA